MHHARTVFAALALFSLAAPACSPVKTDAGAAAQGGQPAPGVAADPLPSWNDGPSRRAILEFVKRVTTAGPDFVPVPERIAVFDNDGTLWAEQPVYAQFAFAIDRVKALAPQHPEWKGREPFASAIKGDVRGVMAAGEQGVAELVGATHSGMTTDEFNATVSEWVATARHPVTKQLYTAMVYQPMLELMNYLRANGFKTFIVSGGGIDFLRPWAEKTYGVPPEQVVGSSGQMRFEERGGSRPPVIVKLPEINLVDDGPGKPVGIERHIGRRPIAAFGNSDGDLEMLQWTGGGNGVRLCVYIHHTDSAREWAYDRASHIGKLDRGLDEAAKGWIVVDMKSDWSHIYPIRR